jgi:hypothetical protein
MKEMRNIKLNGVSICEEWNIRKNCPNYCTLRTIRILRYWKSKKTLEILVSLLRWKGPFVTYLEADEDHDDR